jgi:beta-glucanase (GH16 family)
MKNHVAQSNFGKCLKLSAALFVTPLIFALTLCPAVAYGQPSGGCTGVANIVIGTTTYVPTWCDEFNGAAGSPDTTVWNFGLGNNGGWGNNEKEVYCGPAGYAGNPSQCPTTFSASTSPVYIDGIGHLVIRPINENGKWLSGRMTTEGLENFTDGILVASIQLPNTTTQGLWAAWWTLGSDITTVPWPGCGEYDIMEDWSPQVSNGEGTTGDISTAHTTKTGGSGVGGRFTFPSGQAGNTAFHTYGVNWAANELQTYVDDSTSPFLTITPSSLPAGDTWPFNQSMFVILNVAVGGTLGGSITNLASPAQPMLVDYVRWYVPNGPVTCSLLPATPAQLAAAASSSSVVGLVWTAVTKPPANCTITGYNVYGSTTSGFIPGSDNLIASVTSNEYTVTGLTDLTTYYYVVEAVDSYGNSAASTQATATTLAPGQVSPEIVAIAAGGPAQNNAGGGDYSFVADEDFVGGALNSKNSSTIDLTQPDANAAPMGVYQNGRNGTITYTIPGLTANAQYTVLLHFTESYFSAAGGRQFNVAINGAAVLTNFDIYAHVGKNAALVEQFTATANSSGQIVIAFTNGAANQPVVMGIEVRSTPASCSADPTAPTGLTATASSSSAIGLTWTAVTPPANCTISGYNVYRSTTSGFTPAPSNLIATLSTTTYADTGLTATTTYYYVVETIDANGASPASNQASATTSTPNFSLSFNPSTLAISGVLGWTTLTVNSVGEFNSTISFACSGLPVGAACSFSPATLTPGGDVPVSTQLMVGLSTPVAAVHRNSNPLLPDGATLAVALCLFGFRKRRNLQLLLLLMVSVIGLGLFTGCNNSNFSPTRQPSTSTVTVTGTAGSLQRTATFTLYVQ